MTTSPLLHRPSGPTAPTTPRYRDVLATPYVTRLLAGAVIGHLPVAMAPLAILVAVRADGGTLSLAGALAAVYGLAAAIGQPLWGRLLDRRGHYLAIGVTAVVSAAAFAALAFLHPAQYPGPAAVVAAVAGLCTPPLEAALRVLWPHVVHSPHERRAALALDACAQELVFIGGPLLVLALHTLTGTTLVLIATAAIVLAGCALFLTTPPTRTWKPSYTPTHWLGPIRIPGLRALAAALFGAGITLGALNVVALAAAERHHAEYLSTMMPAALAAGSLIGGLLYGRRTWPGSPTRQLLAIGGGFAVGSLPMLADPIPALAITTAVLPGLFLAPLLVTAFHTLDFLVPRHTLAEASAWLIACLGLGQAAGTALAGLVPAATAPAAAAGVAAGGAAAGFVVLWATRRRLTPDAGHPATPPTAPSR
ncbi:MFS transporter [Streptomyces marianii]|uniref:MFS transporter n=1 Tax=Streptomyces marianii TaxID=1817406 RepID=A0A5R9DRZ1_9ACTN|nr:MFS transporter [Streptomyces marianii]TLQ39269.1 MFS transporter [Streptomyces marianii]